jgi:hypothetical protein
MLTEYRKFRMNTPQPNAVEVRGTTDDDRRYLKYVAVANCVMGGGILGSFIMMSIVVPDAWKDKGPLFLVLAIGVLFVCSGCFIWRGTPARRATWMP